MKVKELIESLKSQNENSHIYLDVNKENDQFNELVSVETLVTMDGDVCILCSYFELL